MSHIGLGGEQIRVWKPSSDAFSNLENMSERENPKRIISLDGRSGALYGCEICECQQRCWTPNIVNCEIACRLREKLNVFFYKGV